MEFKYNKLEKTYFTTKKLNFGYTARFYVYPVEILNNKIVKGSLYEIALAIAKSKKDLNAWNI